MIPKQIAEVEIKYSSKVRCLDRTKISQSGDCENVLRTIFPSLEHVEYAYLLLLNRQNQILGYHQLSKGGMTGAVVDVRVIFQVALKACAISIILAHNHPSGNLACSDADRKITTKIKQAGVILDIPLLDHLIMTTDSYLSMADEGIL